MEDAIKALNTLQKEHIGEVKRFANPPALVAFCLEAVCILFGRKPTWPEAQVDFKFGFWPRVFALALLLFSRDALTSVLAIAFQKLLGELDFLEQCKHFDRDNIPPSVIKKLEKYIKNADFTPDKMANVSAAATSLCKWVIAVNLYSLVAKDIEPKKKALHEVCNSFSSLFFIHHPSSLHQAEETLHHAQSVLAAKQESLRVVQVWTQ